MVARVLLLAVLLLGLYSTSPVKGVTLSLSGSSITTDGSGRIVITDINPDGDPNNDDALICQSELTTLTDGGNWFLHPTQQTTDGSIRIASTDIRGWLRNREIVNGGRRLVRLRRDDDVASGGNDRALEGVFTCHIPGDTNTPVHVGIYYPISSVVVTINVESSRQGTFTVTCTASGGTVVSSSLTGPGGVDLTLQPVGSIVRTGQNTYSITSGTLSGRSNGDTYQCTAADNLSPPHLSDSAMLRVPTDPTIVSLVQVSATTVRVEWSQPSGGATVTGYTVHYSSNGVTNSVSGLPSSATSHEITGLTNGRTYSISVEATSIHLSGGSETETITLLPPPAAPEGVSVSEVQPHSVRMSWQAVEGADTYTVRFTQTMGDEQLGLCVSSSHSGSVETVNGLTVVIMGEGDDMLRAFTTYSITVVAVSAVLGSGEDSQPVTVTTAQTNSTAVLVNFRATVQSSSSISVQWDRLTPCKDVNGLIVEFRVQYRELPSGPVQTLPHSVQPEIWNTPVEVSLTGLTPFTNYSIQAAPVNDQSQVGSYSGPVVTQTQEDTPGPVVITSSSHSFFKISITWDPPEIRNGIIIAYEVSYRSASAPQTITTMNTTDLDTSFTNQGRLELGTTYIFTVTAFTRAGRGEIVTASISTLSRPPAVEGVEVTALNATAVTVSWSALVIPDFSIDHYTVLYSRVESQRRRRQDGAMSAQFPSTATSGMIAGLDSTATYQFQVFATVTVDGIPLEGEKGSQARVPDDGKGSGSSGGSNAGGIAGGLIVAIIAVLAIVVLAIVGIVVVVLWVLRKRRGSSEKSSYRPASESTSLPLAPVQYTKSTKAAESASNGETKMAEPVIAKFPEDKHAVEGEKVILRVKVTGSPQPKLTWYHNGEEVVADYSRELTEDGSLTLPSAEAKHSGVYQLVAQNPVGSMEREMKLFVKQEGQPSPHVAKKQIQLSAISIENFGDFVAQSHASNNRDFRDQYTEVDKDAGHSTSIGSSPNHKPLNRFANITVYDDNRIILRPIEGHSDCQRDFINACYVDGYKFRNKFIATQGPLPKTLVDFWRLVWQEKPPTIVMVTNLKEGTKIKCQQYWPESGAQSFGPFQVTISDQQILADYTTRSLLVQLTGSSERALKVTQFHFTAWPDHGVPDYATPILAFHRKIKKHHRPSKGPMLVHCSAGVGRTGTLITIDRVLDQIKKEGVVDIAGIVHHLRSQRMKLVQNPEQYVFIHDAILEAVTCGDTQISASDLRRNIQKLSRRDQGTRSTGFESQFKVLEQVSPNPSEVKCDIALQNPTRNRSEEFVPADRWRVVLKGEVEDYIHATVVNGYKQQRAFIVAQGPMQSTARDFWKMIHNRKCGVVVMLSDLVEAGKEVCYQYWPSSGIVNIGEYTIDLLGEEKLEGFVLRTLSVLHNKSGKAHQVVQLHITNWTSDGRCSNLTSVTDVIAEMSKIQRRTGNHPIVVHCSDTVSRSGMFCAIATTIERCKTEGLVDVFQVVKALRVQKPGAVRTVSQYHTLFEAVLVYLDSFDTYGNFQDL